MVCALRFNGLNGVVQWMEKQLPCGGRALRVHGVRPHGRRGLDEASGQGIGSATAQVGGKTVAWTNESREGIDAESATFALDESSELPPEGRYTADLTFVRTKADGETENLVVHDAPILIAEP